MSLEIFMVFVWCLFLIIRTFFLLRASLVAENLALRQQLAVLKRQKPTPRLKKRDRLFWIVLSKLWSGWKKSLLIVQPSTVLRWHRKGFKIFWSIKSRKKAGRPKIDVEIRRLIRQLSKENPRWGVPHIKSELALLGYDVAESTIAKYIFKHPKPPSQTWRTFLKNHAADIVACDYFTAYTVTFRIYYVFVMLRHSDRKIVHFSVTQNPTMEWTFQQVREAFPFDTPPRYLLHNNGSVFSRKFRHKLKILGIESVRTAYRSPWQNPYVERVNGTLRGECLDHLIILNERHLWRILSEFIDDYFNTTKPHLSLNRNSPIPRKIDPPSNGKIVSTPILGGLHHRYHRVA
jgi:putative transposase